MTFPLFGLSELANVYVPRPINPTIEAPIGGHFIMFLQSPMVKAMEEQVPLSVRPPLLMYLRVCQQERQVQQGVARSYTADSARVAGSHASHGTLSSMQEWKLSSHRMMHPFFISS